MRYLLDVNALIAFAIPQHQFHERVSNWVKAQHGASFLTCPLTELGFVRVIPSIRIFLLNTRQAKSLLLRMKANTTQPLQFLADGNDISKLPDWVNRSPQITDGHLARLAATHDAILATLDESIPGALLIPMSLSTGSVT